MIKAVLFDYNGTMVLDEDVQRRSWISFLSDLLKKEITDADYFNHVRALINKECLEYWLQRELTQDEADQLGSIKERLYRDYCLLENIQLAHGLTDLLDYLKDHHYLLNIATGAPYDNMQFAFAMYNLSKWFDLKKMVYDDKKVRGKPYPDIFIKAYKNLEVKPEECLVFEDSMVGVKAAINAKVTNIILMDPYDKIKENQIMVDGHVIKVFDDYSKVDLDIFK